MIVPCTPSAIRGYTKGIVCIDTCVLFRIGRLVKTYDGPHLIKFLEILLWFSSPFEFTVRRARSDVD